MNPHQSSLASAELEAVSGGLTLLGAAALPGAAAYVAPTYAASTYSPTYAAPTYTLQPQLGYTAEDLYDLQLDRLEQQAALADYGYYPAQTAYYPAQSYYPTYTTATQNVNPISVLTNVIGAALGTNVNANRNYDYFY